LRDTAIEHSYLHIIIIKLLVHIVVNRLRKKQYMLGGIIPAILSGSIIDDKFVGVLQTLGLVLKGC
jgi:hypothetical protein